MIEVIDRKFPGLTEVQKMPIYDMTSGLYNTILGVGQVIGPIYATSATSAGGFSLCCDGAAFGSLVLAVTYLIFTRLYRPAPKPLPNPVKIISSSGT